ncbi:Cysteine proteinase 15A [Glycine soja]|nr:Cysteine proteinase 15A [Glycine soja]
MEAKRDHSITCLARVSLFLFALTLSSAHESTTVHDIARKLKVGDNELLRTEKKFKVFMENYGRSYSTREEYLRRLGIFSQNMLRAAEHQALDPTAVHGVTQFSDLTEVEFEKLYTGVNGGGRCGSCWAFSTTGSIEGANFLATGKLVSLKKTSCDNGCNGGLMTNAYNYLLESGGLEEESSYPYTGERGECKFDPEKITVRITNFTNIPVDENQIAAYLVKNGPLAMGVNAIFMQTYIGGVSCPLICSKKRLNHGVLLVGYGAKGFSILRLGNKPYWIIKNSWGKKWGEDGYYKLCRGHGMCGINTMVSAAMVAQPQTPTKNYASY